MSLPGELRIVDDVARAFTDVFVEAFRSREHDGFSIALSGGDTARRCYEDLARRAAGDVDWWKVDVHWAEERCVPADHPDSHYRMARGALLDRVGAAHATHLMRCGEGPDPYQLRLGELGRIDLVHLGMGTDGRIAGLFPGSDVLDADPGRLVLVSEDPTGLDPTPRMTLTLGGIARARRLVITVTGAEHADALGRAASGERLPASRLDAPSILWLVDAEAASACP